MAPARFLSVRRRFWLAVSAHPPTFKFFPPGPRAGPGAAGPGQVLDKWRRFIAPRFSPGFLPVPQGPNYIPGMEVQEKVSLWTCLSVPRVDRLRPLVPCLHVYTGHYTHPPHHCQLCQPCQLTNASIYSTTGSSSSSSPRVTTADSD